MKNAPGRWTTQAQANPRGRRPPYRRLGSRSLTLGVKPCASLIAQLDLFTDDTAPMSHRYLIVIATVVALGLPAQALAEPEHEITAGESLTSIAAADGLSVSQLAAANGLSPDAQLTTGATLQIPARSAAATPSMSAGGGQATVDGSETSAAAATGSYRVVSGDTLSAIAARHGVTVSALAAANGLDPGGLLTTSMTLTIPGASPATTDAATPAASSVSGAQPTGETVSPALVGAVAASHGVSPSLAEAIADQESGFNNAEVSPTGAVGVMQIEPGTWDYLHTQLGVPVLDPASASDNVLGGVELLRSLLEQTGGDPQLAAAGYYQGLGSVQAHGMYADTRQYVADVTALQARFGGG
jgi:LysM repeat protein